jgi:putative ABC transport system permease protein
VAQRKKEVGIRKVLGASVTSILALFSADFLKLTAIAFVAAVPVAYWGAQQWLQGFAYRIELGPMLFLMAGGIVAAVAVGTVSVQAIQAARLDPVQNLRDE